MFMENLQITLKVWPELSFPPLEGRNTFWGFPQKVCHVAPGRHRCNEYVCNETHDSACPTQNSKLSKLDQRPDPERKLGLKPDFLETMPVRFGAVSMARVVRI